MSSAHIFLKDGSGLEVDQVSYPKEAWYVRAMRDNGEVWWVPLEQIKMIQFKVTKEIIAVKQE